MLADLERLIRLQQIDTFLEEARRRIAGHPASIEALDSRLASATESLADAKRRLEETHTARRAVEKDLAMVQSRLSKYKDQLMEVKTNREYQAMLKEIEVAQNEVRRLEDLILEHMLASDERTAQVKEADARLAEAKKSVAEERQRLEREVTDLSAELERSQSARQEVAAGLPPTVLDIYDTLAKGRRGLALAEAKGGLCTACHVRLRPQMYNEIRRNDTLFQCGSCQRILYFVHPAEGAAAEPAAGSGQ